MTERERLTAMAGALLIMEADKLGVKVRCNRTRTQLKEAKTGVVDRILEARHVNDETDKIIAEHEMEAKEQKAAEKETKEQVTAEEMVPIPGSNIDQEKGRERGRQQSVDQIKKPKRGQLIEYNGRSQNICAWAKELGISANTLYGRLYRLGWPVEKAFSGGKSNE